LEKFRREAHFPFSRPKTTNGNSRSYVEKKRGVVGLIVRARVSRWRKDRAKGIDRLATTTTHGRTGRETCVVAGYILMQKAAQELT
jgi:hypothetical protein